jgi:hypothetical protein
VRDRKGWPTIEICGFTTPPLDPRGVIELRTRTDKDTIQKTGSA